jgi:hypothetical protein
MGFGMMCTHKNLVAQVDKNQIFGSARKQWGLPGLVVLADQQWKLHGF